jgi:hypothetical protein
VHAFAELTDRLLVAFGQADAEVAGEGRRELLAWATRIAAGTLAAAEGEHEARCAPAARRVQALAQFLELSAAYPAEPPARDDLVGSVRRQVRRDCALLLQLQDPATGGFLGSAEDPVLQIEHTQHAISALLGAAYAIGD